MRCRKGKNEVDKHVTGGGDPGGDPPSSDQVAVAPGSSKNLLLSSFLKGFKYTQSLVEADTLSFQHNGLWCGALPDMKNCQRIQS